MHGTVIAIILHMVEQNGSKTKFISCDITAGDLILMAQIKVMSRVQS